MMTAWHGSGQATHGCTMESPFTTDLTSLNSPCRHLPTQALLLLRSSSFSTSLDDLGQSTTARKYSMFRLSEHVTFPPFFLSLSSRTIPPPFYNDVTYRVCVCPVSDARRSTNALVHTHASTHKSTCTSDGTWMGVVCAALRPWGAHVSERDLCACTKIRKPSNKQRHTPSSTRSCRRRNWSRTRNYMRTGYLQSQSHQMPHETRQKTDLYAVYLAALTLSV